MRTRVVPSTTLDRAVRPAARVEEVALQLARNLAIRACNVRRGDDAALELALRLDADPVSGLQRLMPPLSGR